MDLNTILIILGVVALIFLVIHGIWSNRKENLKYVQNKNIFTQESRIREPQEPLHNNNNKLAMQTHSPHPSSSDSVIPSQQSLDFEHTTNTTPERNDLSNLENDVVTVDKIKISLPKSHKPVMTPVEPVSDNIPDLTNMSIAELEASIDPEEGINSSSQIVREQLSKIAQGKLHTEDKIEYPMHSRPKPQYRTESPINTRKENVNKPTQKTIERPKPVEEVNTIKNHEAPKENTEGNFIMLYVVAPENRDFNGANIAQTLDNLGFIYGNKQIYHRHLDLSITSPVLFSVANIQQPGTFDPENMMDFYTIGLAVFMQLPSYGNDLANLRLMIRAARTIAEELGGYVLTDKQEIFTDQAEQEYLNKVA